MSFASGFWALLPERSGYMCMCNAKGCGLLWDEEESEEEGVHWTRRSSAQTSRCAPLKRGPKPPVYLDYFSLWECVEFLWRCVEETHDMEVEETGETRTSWYDLWVFYVRVLLHVICARKWLETKSTVLNILECVSGISDISCLLTLWHHRDSLALWCARS